MLMLLLLSVLLYCLFTILAVLLWLQLPVHIMQAWWEWASCSVLIYKEKLLFHPPGWRACLFLIAILPSVGLGKFPFIPSLIRVFIRMDLSLWMDIYLILPYAYSAALEKNHRFFCFNNWFFDVANHAFLKQCDLVIVYFIRAGFGLLTYCLRIFAATFMHENWLVIFLLTALAEFCTKLC